MRPFPGSVVSVQPQFQCTHSERGATLIGRCLKHKQACFNPRTPGGVRQQLPWYYSYGLSSFNPRTPGGVRPLLSGVLTLRKSFNPRTPGGVRHLFLGKNICLYEFQSTHPGRGATIVYLSYLPPVSVSIHAPRAGCDLPLLCVMLTLLSFNPRTPGGVRRQPLGGNICLA